jgi:hypothetical protein
MYEMKIWLGEIRRLGKVERTMERSIPFHNRRHFSATIRRLEELFEQESEILSRVPSRRAGHALSKLSIIDVSISKTFDKIQKSIVDLFTRSANQGHHRKQAIGRGC